MTKLNINNLSFYYTEEEYVLNNINLVLSEKTTAIIGQNGAGKTTLVKLIKGLLKPISGNIYLNDKDISEQTVAQLSSKIGLVFQNPNDQIFKNKVIDEVMFGPLNIGLSHEQARKQAQGSLQKVGLYGHKEDNPYDLSLAERKMIATASILAMDTDVIIFDEPTMGQDHEGKELIKTIIQELKREGKLVLCILHDMDFAVDVFERILVFNQGELLLDGSPSEVFTERSILHEAHLEQPQVMSIAKHLGLEQLPLNEEELINLLRKN